MATMVGQPPLLERERELETLEALLADARAGHGGIVLIEGDAGIGKSRLLLAARHGAEAAGMRVLSARGSELEQGFAFGITTQLLGDVAQGGPQAIAAGDGYSAILALYDRLRTLARDETDQVPMLVIVDDVQWADEPSLQFLAHVALRIDELPIALVAAVRLGDLAASSALLKRLEASRGADVLVPRPLSEQASAAMVHETLDEAGEELAAACFHATRGNPFYLSELLRTLAIEPRPRAARVSEVAPATVLRSVVIRLARLGTEASAVARAAAVLGDGTPLSVVAGLAEVPEPAAEVAADALARTGILEPGDPLRFAHPLIASALEADMGTFERARAHRRAADLLRAEGVAVERVAGHLMLARPQRDVEVVETLEEAASRASASGAPAAASRLLARALEEPPPIDREPEVLLALAKAEAQAGSPTAPARFEQALGRMTASERRAEALADLANLAHVQWDLGRAIELASRGRAELPDDHPLQQRLTGIELSAAVLDPDAADWFPERLEPVLASVRNGDLPSDPRLLAMVVGWIGISEPPAEVRPLAEAAIAIDPLIDESYGTSLGWIASALEWIDELELAETWLDRAIEAAHRTGAVIAGSTAVINRARMRLFRGRLDDAVADAERALDIYRFGWTASPWSSPALAMAHLARGDIAAAREAIALGERASSGVPDHGRVLEARARLQLADGDPAGALASALALEEILRDRFARHQPRVWEWRRIGALAAHTLGEDARAQELLEPDVRTLREIGPARQLGEALTVEGLITGGEAGAELLAEAAGILERSPARLRWAETLLALGAARRRLGRRTDAKEPLYKALALAAEFGAAPLEREARDELGRLGLRPRRTARSGVASLTPSELQVAELAAEGMTTPQIAGRLHVTANTVETHLRHIYQKLSVSGRRELPSALERAVQTGS